METLEILDVARDALWVLIKISTPLMLVALFVGLAIGLLQALTQIQEMTLTFVPKILAIFLSIILFMPFFVEEMTDLQHRLSEKIIHIQ